MSGSGTGPLTLDGSTTLSARGGQSIVASMLTLAGDGSAVLVDASGTIEIGSAGGAAAGALTVDDGATIDGTTTNSIFPASVFGVVIDNGLIAAVDLDFGNQYFFTGLASSAPVSRLSGAGTVEAVAGGMIEIGGAVAPGDLTVQADSGATLRFDAAVGAGNTVVLAGTGDVARIGAPGATSPIAFDAAISGFGTTDALLISGASITGAVASGGTLTLLDGTVPVENLLVPGAFAGEDFVTVTLPGAGVEIVPAATGSSGGAGAGTGTVDHYLWIGPLAGSWSEAGNWQDASTGASPAAAAPGGLDVVTIDGASGIARIIGGAGDAATLVFAGTNAVAGTISAGTLSNTGALVVAAHGVLAAGTAVTTAAIVVDGSFRAGVATLDNDSTLTASGGGSVTLGALTAFGDGTGLAVDSASMIHVGGTGAASLGALTIDRGATLSVTTPNTIFPTSMLGAIVDNGLIAASELDIGWAYFLTGTISTGPATSLSGAGSLEAVAGGTMEVGCAVAAGGLDFKVDSGATLRLDSTVGAGNTVSLLGAGDVLRLGAAGSALLAGFDAVIAGFQGTDVVDVIGATGATSSTATNAGTTTLTLTKTGTALATLVFSGVAAGGVNFNAASGTVTACYAAGTRLATPGGPARIETLRIGDPVLTWDGRALPVRWLGHRALLCETHPRPEDVWPVRILAGAFSAGRPVRDLWLSPDHAVFMGREGAPGVLIPIRHLINGATVATVRVRQVTYWHVELATHEILWAEGLPAESYLDTGNREAFANVLEPVARGSTGASQSAWTERGAAPLVVQGPDMVAAHAALLARLPALGFTVTADPALCLLVDGVPATPRRHGAWLRLELPPRAKKLGLMSRVAAPCFLDAARDDRRLLGVLVEGVRLDGAALPLDHPRLSAGWHAPEAFWRWTGGAAELSVQGARVVELAVALDTSGLAFVVPAAAAAAATVSSSPAWSISPAHAG